MSDVAEKVSNDWRLMHNGEWEPKALALWEAIDRSALPDLTQETSRPKECGKYGPGCDLTALPVHQSCECPCYGWSGCDDPACDHPACDRRHWQRFQSWWEETHGEVPDRDIVAWASPWTPWIDHGRHAALLEEERSDEKAAARLLCALEKGIIEPISVTTDYLNGEISLHLSGLIMESRWACFKDARDLHFDAAMGRTHLGSGGLVMQQLRLPTAVDLAVAPAGFQGALFVE